MDAQPVRGIVISPMGVGEVIDAGFTLARRNFKYLASIAAWGLIIGAVFQALLAASSFSSGVERASATGAVAGGLGSVIGGIAAGLAGLAVVLACARLVDPQDASDRITAGEAYRAALNRMPALIGLAIIAGFAAIPLIIVFPLGVYILIRWANAFNAVVIERMGPIAALGRSWALTRRAWWHTFAVLVLLTIAIYIVETVLGGLAMVVFAAVTFGANLPTIGAVVSAVAGAIVSIVVTPFSTAVGVVLYYELRARAEGFDLEQRVLEVAPAE